MKNDHTLTTSCFNQIRSWILTGDLLPGEKLKGEYLKHRLGTGLTPIREALSRLVNTGLVTFREKMGFSVANLSEDKVRNTWKAHAKIEAMLLLRESIQNGDDNWEADIMAALYKLSKVETGSKVEYDTWVLRNDEFHNALISSSKLDGLLQVRNELKVVINWYHRLSNKYGQEIIANHDEHAKLAQLVLSRKDLACTYLYNHLIEGMDSIIEELKHYGLIKSSSYYKNY